MTKIVHINSMSTLDSLVRYIRSVGFRERLQISIALNWQLLWKHESGRYFLLVQCRTTDYFNKRNLSDRSRLLTEIKIKDITFLPL